MHDTLAAFMFHSIGSLFKFNLLLQIFDGLFTYHVVSQQGLPEANPLVRNTIYEWGWRGELFIGSYSPALCSA